MHLPGALFVRTGTLEIHRRIKERASAMALATADARWYSFEKAVSYQPSAISYQLAASNCSLSQASTAINGRGTRFQLLAFSFCLSAFSF